MESCWENEIGSPERAERGAKASGGSSKRQDGRARRLKPAINPARKTPMSLGSPRSARPRRAMFVGLAAIVALTGIGASCSGASRETTPSVPEVADARLPRTDLRLVVITDLMGYLEPCGCTSRPLGGIDRLAAALREARAGSAPTLFLAAGDLFFDGTSHGVEVAEAATQEIWKAETVADVLSRLELAAAVPGPLDLRFGAERLEALRARERFP
ncbi:MAG: hypothetical protein M3Y87_32990, partial [Myxococcota bacterium]|nr:hypothetical protein [Myxococcota bacterium]